MLRAFASSCARSIRSVMSKSSIDQPLLIVAGCTGTGKSDLGVAIAEKFNGEIISADSMQIYKGLDIVTNKITDEEARGIPHHLMSFVEPKDEYNVHAFQSDTLRLIDEIRSRQRLPILVGGTAYYIESVMYKDALINCEDSGTKTEGLRSQLFKKPADELYAQLKERDPEAAKMIHPNNHFRVMRALEVCLLSGMKKSELNSAQQHLRFPNTLLVILDANFEVLDERLDKRVVKMEERGVLQELDDYYAQYKDVLGTHGVRQSIGIKEFLPFLELSEDNRPTSKGQRILKQCYEDLKLHTRKYSRTQRKWFKQRFMRRAKLREVPPTLTLDTSSSFFDLVVPYALDRVDEFLSSGSFNSVESSCVIPNDHQQIEDKDYVQKANTIFYCPICSIHIQSHDNYEKHMGGRRHKRQIQLNERKRQNENSELDDKEVEAKVAKIEEE